MKTLQGQQASERREEWLAAPLVAFPEGEAFRLPQLSKLTAVMIQKDEKSLGLEFQTEQGPRVRVVLAELAAEQLVRVALRLSASGHAQRGGSGERTSP